MLRIILAQYSFRTFIKGFGIKEEKSVTDKLSQINDIRNFFSVEPKTIRK